MFGLPEICPLLKNSLFFGTYPGTSSGINKFSLLYNAFLITFWTALLFYYIKTFRCPTLIFLCNFLSEFAISIKLAIHLSFLAFWHFVNYFVRLWTNHYTLLTISPISFIFDSARNFPYLLFDVAWKYRLSSENGETRDEKNDWRDGLRDAIYTLIGSLILPTFCCVLVNLTISV